MQFKYWWMNRIKSAFEEKPWKKTIQKAVLQSIYGTYSMKESLQVVTDMPSLDLQVAIKVMKIQKDPTSNMLLRRELAEIIYRTIDGSKQKMSNRHTKYIQILTAEKKLDIRSNAWDCPLPSGTWTIRSEGDTNKLERKR